MKNEKEIVAPVIVYSMLYSYLSIAINRIYKEELCLCQTLEAI